jgi:ATP-dependent RNA helicase RhlE
LLDHIERGNIRLDQIEVFVLDEADRMLDMGFLPDIRRVISMLPKKKQTMLFSATFPQEIMKLCKELLQDPAHVQVGDRSQTAKGITHTVYPVPAHLKPSLLEAILRNAISDDSPILVFTRTKHRADKLQKILSRTGFKIVALHSDRTQKQRQAALDGFRKGKHQILVATDIAARGIDIVGISHVINYDVPATPEDYVHRTGRTARAEREGDAFTLMAPDEEILMIQIEKHMGQTLAREAIRDFNYSVPAPEKRSSLEKTSGQAGPARRSFSSRRARIPRKG